MKQSTWRYFQRENELPLQMKVDAPRRDERRRGRPCDDAAPSDSASDAIATPCGSCAWMTSGCSRLMTRASRHAAVRSISVRGASGMSSSPSAARRRSSPSGMRDERRALADRAQAVHGQQHLVLAAAPGPRRVDVEGEHRSRFTSHGSRGHGSRVPGSGLDALAWTVTRAPRASRTSGTRSTRSSPR